MRKCERSFLQCDNPCDTDRHGCHLLPTQLDTFTTQFFGDGLTKSIINNQIVWDLPCGLSSGVVSNPILPGESLACYFLRLFEAGVPGMLGPVGAAGIAGAPGADAFSVTQSDFDQPTLQAPYVAVKLQPVPFFIEQLYVIVANSGEYQILQLEPDGSAVLQLLIPYADAPSEIPAGSLVIVSGFPGIRTIGPIGPRGPQGPAGITGGQGIPGRPGGTGPQGPNAKLFSRTATAVANAIQLSGTYSVYPNYMQSWQTPDAQNATFFLMFQGSIGWFNGDGTGFNGTISVKVSEFDANGNFIADVPASTRQASWNTGSGFSDQRNFYIPVLVQNTTGNIAEWNIQAKATGIGGNIFGLWYTGGPAIPGIQPAFTTPIKGFRIQPSTS